MTSVRDLVKKSLKLLEIQCFEVGKNHKKEVKIWSSFKKSYWRGGQSTPRTWFWPLFTTIYRCLTPFKLITLMESVPTNIFWKFHTYQSSTFWFGQFSKWPKPKLVSKNSIKNVFSTFKAPISKIVLKWIFL